MQTLNRLKINNNNLRKSHALLFGSFLIFLGVLSVSWNYLLRMKDEVYSDMRIAMMDVPAPVVDEPVQSEEVIQEVPIAENVSNTENTVSYIVDYSKYLGVLEIPTIGLKRGFYNTDSKYNNIQYNVAMVKGSDLPDVDRGNLILIAHSGNAYYSYFAFLYRLGVGDMVYVTYGGRQYAYKIVNIYEVVKNGVVTIKRDIEKTTLTMITCTRGTDFSQTVYISELVG